MCGGLLAFVVIFSKDRCNFDVHSIKAKASVNVKKATNKNLPFFVERHDELMERSLNICKFGILKLDLGITLILDNWFNATGQHIQFVIR